MWDIGGQREIRPYWKNYFENTDGLVYVVDSSDDGRLKECHEELANLIGEEALKKVPLLVFANKQDLPNACETAQMVNELGLNQLHGRKWYIMSCCATSGEGLFEGLDWLSKELSNVQ